MTTWDGSDRRRNNRSDDYDELLERIHGIEREIGRLSSHIESEDGNKARIIDEMAKMLANHDHTLYGNAKPGLRSEVDRLKEIESKRDWHIKALTGAVIAGFVNVIVRYFTEK